ncbi:MAG: helix-turn-helix domain-containing protein [Faecousia sp.]
MLSKRIHDLRLSFGWSQVELARRLQVSKQAVSNWENDNIQPSIDMLIRLADTFGVSTDFLLGREDTPRLSTAGLTAAASAHLALLIEDLRVVRGNPNISLDKLNE